MPDLPIPPILHNCPASALCFFAQISTSPSQPVHLLPSPAPLHAPAHGAELAQRYLRQHRSNRVVAPWVNGPGKESAGDRAARPSLRHVVPPSNDKQPQEKGRMVSWLDENGDENADARVREPGAGVETAEVICISACKDSQRSWEGADGGSMTRELVRILECDPHPSLRSLVTSVSNAMHRMSLKRHLETRRYKRDLKRYAALLERHRQHKAVPDVDIIAAPKKPQARARSEGFGDAPLYDMDNFPEPQLVSHQPLDMERPWNM
ncbi:hypothetical protein B0H13DRAFT_2350726 [Mycena leptocephala]|nr:hypothetical protein B0H13DRAFT_2350726 [Mycena leptocephala]